MSDVIIRAWENIISQWEQSNKTVLHTEHNKNVLIGAVKKAIERNVTPSLANFHGIVESIKPLLQLGQMGVEQTQSAPQAVEPEPAETLPHADEPSLKKFNYMEDFNKDNVAAFCRAASRDPRLHQKFNDRHAFIKEHGLRRPTEEPTPAKPVSPEQAKKNELLAEARTIIDGLSPANIGSVSSGRFDQLAKLKKRCEALYQQMLRTFIVSGVRDGLDELKAVVAAAENTSVR
jgi:hypothetical protein